MSLTDEATMIFSPFRNAYELQALHESLKEIKQNLRKENTGKFQNFVEVHMQHIQSGLTQMGNLHAFMKPQQQTQVHPVKPEPV